MIRYSLHLLTSGGFEVCAFDSDGGYVLCRRVCTIEEAAWLLRVPLLNAQCSTVGVGPE